MKTPYFTGKTTQPPAQPVVVPVANRRRQTHPAGYLADPGLVDAVNVALLLGQPLLLTGEPGTGKTQLAYRIAWELGFGVEQKPLLFEAKSTSTAKDLFYTYDSLRRFHAAHTPEASKDNRDYLTYNALGLAILYANEPAAVRAFVPSDFPHPGKLRSVVLIDEVDKAPRDFPNDLLNEVEHMYFRIPELNNARITAEAELRPILIISSNSERNLPDAFLRRCVYYHIPFPDKDRLASIVLQRVGNSEAALRDEKVLHRALDFFLQLRERSLHKKPSTAELINWINVLASSGTPGANALAGFRDQLSSSLSTLVKHKEDLEEAERFVREYLK